MNQAKRRTLKGSKPAYKRMVDWYVLLPITAALVYGIYHYSDYKSPYFWIAGVYEIFMAIVLAFCSLTTRIRFFLSIAALFFPAIIASFVHFLYPIGTIYLFFLIVVSWLLYFKKTRLGKSAVKVKDKMDITISPSYVPEGFSETEMKEYRKKGFDIKSLIFSEDHSGYLIWIEQSQGDVFETSKKKNVQTFNKVIKDIAVNIEQEIAKPRAKPKSNPAPLFIEANWKYKDINFNLRSDGLSLDELEKVISSMINWPGRAKTDD